MQARTGAFIKVAIVLGLFQVPAVSLADEALGRLTSATGPVTATDPSGAQRSLSCGDSVFAGETISTSPGGSAAVLANDVLTQVAGSSAVRMARTDDGALDATLERGRVRMIDARETGSPARLGANDAVVRVAGNDAEGYLLVEKIGPYAMFCEWDAPLEVARRSESATANPGECVIAKGTEPLYVADAHDERIPATGADMCPPDLTHLAEAGPHFPDPLPGVGAGSPSEPWNTLAGGPTMPRRDPCDDPGAGCRITNGSIIVISEPPPGTDPQPGGENPFPGANLP
jgi:hypothetical protein